VTHRRLTSLAAAVVLLALAAVHPQSPPLPSGASDKTATVFGSKIRYLDAGSGPAVVLLHGLGGDSSHWAPAIGALSQKFRVIVPDQIGFGRSDKPFLNYRVGTLVDFLDGLFRELKLERASLVGSSLGGWTAAAFALAHPEKVARLALVGSAGFALAPDFDPRALNKLNPSTLEGARALLSSVFYNRETFASAAAAEQLLARHATVGDGYTIQRFVESIARREDVLDNRLSALKAPTLIIWGREDALTPLALAERFKREIAGAELVVIDKCGHVPQLEKPAESNAALLGFLGGSAPPGAALRQAPGDRPNVLWILGELRAVMERRMKECNDREEIPGEPR